jgi:hypothetical protein
VSRSPRQRFHGDPERFEVVASFVAARYGRAVRYVADVAGGQGMLARILRKSHGYEAEVVDPRGWALRGVHANASTFEPGDATYYDLIVGLHPDEATRAVAEAATVRPVVLVPCCNFWDRSRRLGRDALMDAIAAFYDAEGVAHEVVELGFSGPMNRALVSAPRT